MKKPSTSELPDWLKLLMVEDIVARGRCGRRTASFSFAAALFIALLKNEQDVHLVNVWSAHMGGSSACNDCEEENAMVCGILSSNCATPRCWSPSREQFLQMERWITNGAPLQHSNGGSGANGFPGSGGGSKKGNGKQRRRKGREVPSWYILLFLDEHTLLGGVLTADETESPTMYLWRRVVLRQSERRIHRERKRGRG